MTELINSTQVCTARLGAGAGAAHHLSDAEVGKFVKLAGDSRYALCAAGDEVEGWIMAVESATLDGYTIGSVAQGERKFVTLDGLQATPGVGSIATGDYVLAGTVVPKGVALSVEVKVVKATDQASAKTSPFALRVLSVGVGGDAAGAPGMSALVAFVR